METIGASKNGTRFLKIDFLILIRAMEEKQKRKLEKVRKAALLVSNARVHVHIYIYSFSRCVRVSLQTLLRFRQPDPINADISRPPAAFCSLEFRSFPVETRGQKRFADRERERERMAMKKSSEKLRLRINRRRSRR